MLSDKLKKYKIAYNKFLKECKHSKSKKCKKLSKSLKRSLRKIKRSVRSKRKRSRKSKRKSVKRRRSRKHDGAWEYRLPVNSVNVQVAGYPIQKYQGGFATLNCENNFTLNDLDNIPCVMQGANINLNPRP
jgi:ATPase subunit of ABC transporter with duplicated ATPase domains